MGKDIAATALSKTIEFIQKKRKLEKKEKNFDLIKKISKKTNKYIKRVRNLQEKNDFSSQSQKKRGSSTLIIGAKCKDGVVMIADRRSMRGMEYKEEKKLCEFYKVIIAFSGLTGLKDKFLEMVDSVLLRARAMNLSEAIVGVEDTMALISQRYVERLGGNARIQALLAGLEHLTSGNAKLYHVVGSGYTEKIDFLCVGHGAPYATSLAKSLYHPSLTMQQMAEIGIFLISWVETVDSSVGGVPDVVFVEDKKGINPMARDKVKQIFNNAKEITEKLPKILPQAIKKPQILVLKTEPKKRKSKKRKKLKK